MAEKRQCAVGAFNLAYEALRKVAFPTEASQTQRTGNGAVELGGVHRLEEEARGALVETVGQLRKQLEAGGEVAANGAEQVQRTIPVVECIGQLLIEAAAFVAIDLQGENLLQLIDHQQESVSVGRIAQNPP